MAYASITYTSASGTTFALTNSSGNAIQYLRQADIAVTVNGTLKTQGTDYTFNSAGTAIVLSASVTNATVVITRTTSITDASVSFTAGSTLTAQDLNNSDKQNRFALQEFSDTYGALTTGSGDLSALAGFIGSSETWLSDNAHAPTTGAVDNRVDSKISTNNATVVLRNGSQAMQAALSLGGFKITNLATPTVSTDAATKAYADAIGASAAADAAAAAASAALANDWATKTSGAVAGGEYSAKYHAQAAATSASNASTSASNASTSATNASNAQAAAEAARDQTLAAYDNFDDRYLGTKTSNPTVDNDGNPLIAGALYFNSVVGEMRLWTGTVWVAAYVSGSGFLATTGGTMTGNITFNGGQTFPIGGIQSSSTSQIGVVQLTDSTSSTSITTAATPNSVKSAYDLANAALPKTGGTMTGAITFAAGQTISGYGPLDTASTWTKGQRGEITALTSASTVTPDFADSNNFSLTLGHNVTLANPTNLTAGQSGAIFITQGSSTAYTMSFGSYWDFSGGTAPTVTSTLSAVDCLVYTVRSSTSIHAQLITNLS